MITMHVSHGIEWTGTDDRDFGWRDGRYMMCLGHSGCEHIHLDVLLVLDDILRNLEPELLAQLVIILGHISIDFRKLQVAFLQCEVNAVLPQAHLRVDMHARLRSASLLA